MLKRIRVDQVQVGMHLHAFCGSWLDHPFWRTRFLLVDPKDVALIRESTIQEVWIDVALGLDVAGGGCVEERESLPPLEPPVAAPTPARPARRTRPPGPGR